MGVIVVGERPPAMSVMWMPPVGPADSGYSVIYSELDRDDDDDQVCGDEGCGRAERL